MPSEPDNQIFKIDLPSKSNVGNRMATLTAGCIHRLLSLDKLEEIYAQVKDHDDIEEFLGKILEELGVTYEVRPGDLARVPEKGPVLVVANHPYGGIEGVILAHLLLKVRPDVRVMANYMLSRIPNFKDIFIFVDPFETKQARLANVRPIREAIRWASEGHLLAIFPSGEVSHLDLQSRAVLDPEWNPLVARIALSTKAHVVTGFFAGYNSRLFQMAGLVHPRLRTAMLPREFLKRADQTVEIRLGGPVPPRWLARYDKNYRSVTDYLRWRTYLLKKAALDDTAWVETQKAPVALKRETPPGYHARIAEEVASLPPEQELLSSKQFRVFWVTKQQAPALAREIGYLREVTFRQVGEGTGQELDLDHFDDYYLHLCLWDDDRKRLVGSYRAGKVDEIVADKGLSGLYTSTLFKYKREFFEKVNPALEMGRSFVRVEYQRSFSALMLLWKGIGRYVGAHPKYRYLVGPVSVSANYQDLSRRLMVDFIEMHHKSPLAPLVKPRTPARFAPLKGFDHRDYIKDVKDINELSDFIADLEGQDYGPPILLKHYLKIYAKGLAWNVDPDFGNALDCLLVCDVAAQDNRTLERYAGPEGLAAFRKYYGQK
jgi:putative hemolysin